MAKINKWIKSFLWYSRLGSILGRVFWQKVSSGPGFEFIYYNKQPVFKNLDIIFDNAELNNFLIKESERWNLQEEYVLKIKDVIVEPKRCLGIRKFNHLIDQTVVYKFSYQYPYILPYLLNRKSVRKLADAVLYDGSATRNYYHHFVNAVNSLYLLPKVPISEKIPFLINRTSFDSPFFQFLYNRSTDFRQINWMVLDSNDWVRVDNLYRIQCLHFDKEPWFHTKHLYSLKEKIPFRKVFLSRDGRRFSRSLANEEEIYQMLSKHGFELAYAENLSIDAQTKLFQETKYLVALSGMGLIQQFFMNYPFAHVLEILPRNRLMPEYFWQASTLGIKYYDIMVGGNMAKDGKYFLSCSELEQKVFRMLQ